MNNLDNDGYYLKKLAPHDISDSVFCPGQGPKPTNVGIVLAKYVHPTDNSYGTHSAKYGGIGYEKIDHPDFITVPRKTNHLRTGVDWDILDPPSVRQREVLVNKNRAFFAAPIKELGKDIYDLFRTTNIKPFESGSKKNNILFPRSSIYDYENIRKKNYEKLKKKLEEAEGGKSGEDKELFDSAKQFEDKMSCTPGSLLKLDCKDLEAKFHKERHTPEPWWPNQPYWYDPNKTGSKPIPKRNLNDFTTHVPSDPVEEHKWLEEMELDNARNYLPGEIYKNKVPKEPVEDLSKTGGCSKVWKPRADDIAEKFHDVENIPNEKPLETEVEERRKMTYSQSLGLESAEAVPPKQIKTPCHFKSRKKKDSPVCECAGCKCNYHSEFGILVPDINLKIPECRCVKCHVTKFNSFKWRNKKSCGCT